MSLKHLLRCPRTVRVVGLSKPHLSRSFGIAAVIFACCLITAGPRPGFGNEPAAAPPIDYSRDVRPILAGHCYQCHGPDEEHRQADLRLDIRESATGSAIVAGQPDQSELIARITADDPDLIMPPPEAKKSLTAAQIDTLRRWVASGAEYETHWSFIAPQSPPLPAVKQSDWPRNAIDSFILARMEREDLSPSPEADRETLIRRVTLDLTGLPPTLEEIDAFLRDDSPDAYRKVVDRLLASPHYGERMTLAWMDAARYGDSSVHHADGPRDMWAWRDWVIGAYNDNKPFDEFTVEQLAGDLLPEATIAQKTATGFHRNHGTTDEGGAIAEEYRVEYVVDRVKTTGSVWMGLTVECGQCHDHKYDPISQREYYGLYAFFNQSTDAGMQTRKGNAAPLVEIPDTEGQREAAELKQQVTELEQKKKEREKQIEPGFEEWLQQAAADLDSVSPIPADMLAHFPLDKGKGNKVTDATEPKRTAKIRGKADWTEGKLDRALAFNGSTYVDFADVGDFERTDAFSYGGWVWFEKRASGSPLARMNDGQGHRGYDLYLAGNRVAMHLINSWPGNALKVTTKKAFPGDQWHHVFVTYDGSSKAKGVTIYVDGQPEEWAIEQDSLTDTTRTDVPLSLGRRNPGSPFRGKLDDIRIYGRTLSATEVAALTGADPIRPLLATPADQRTKQQVATLRRHYLHNHDAAWAELNEQIAAHRSRITELSKPLSTVMVLQEMPQPRPTYMLMRGQYNLPLKDEVISPGTPAALPPMADDLPRNRLGLARWLTSPEHPLTARVTVNRYWAMLFGTGIVETPGDFGSQGAYPSHPQLLDWLARDFIDSGWDTKRMLRQMVMSATYRQSSRVTPELRQRDPQNRLLARGPRFRLQGEFIRDQALAVSGLLVPKIGGPGVKPYQPPGLWNEVSLSGNVRFVQDQGEKLYRRSMYTYWKRSAPAPSMLIFDAPTREKCTLQRARTNTPLQALVTLNDPQFVEASRVMAERILKEGGPGLDERIGFAYRIATGTRPDSPVGDLLANAWQREADAFRSEPERATALLKIGEAPRDESLDPAEHAAWTVIASMILNLDAVLTRR